MRRERIGSVETLWLSPSLVGRGYVLDDWSYILDSCAQFAADETVTVVVLRAEGAAFSVGADVADLAAHVSGGQAEHYKSTTRGAIRALAELPMPTVAVIEGRCVAGSTALVNACDVRIGGLEASFEFPPARLGLVYPQLSMELLVRAVGDPGAKWLLYSGRSVGADEALRLGLLQEVAPDAAAALDRLLGEIAEGAATSHRGHKRLLAGVAATDAPAVEQTGYSSARFADIAAAAARPDQPVAKKENDR
jgi:enoyl-CoA hydratase/carnithine racemase